MDMNQQHRMVSAWLGTVLGDDSVPQYEIDEHTIKRLDELRMRSEEQDRLTTAVIGDYTQKATEYRAETERINGVLAKMQMTPESLGQSGTLYLRTLSQAALVLQAADTSSTSLLLSITEAAQKRMQLEQLCREEQRLSAELLSKTKQALYQASKLNKALASVEEQAELQAPDLQKKSKQAGFLTSKAREYKKHIQSLQLDLAHSQADPSVYHSTLLAKSEELTKIKAELKPLKAKLESYHQLPPDLSLATVKVGEARRELEHLEDELSRHINMMHL